MALAPDHVQAVRSLRAAGLSQVAAAGRLGVSRRTVQRIEAADRHGGRPPVAADLDPDYRGRKVRCPHCGGLAVPPCRACQVTPRSEGDDPPELCLALRPAEQARYEALTRARATDEVFATLANRLPEEWLADGLPQPSDEVLRDIARRSR